ncbi:hypothetical protein MKW92_049805, partial [Papaver armeniacum]
MMISTLKNSVSNPNFILNQGLNSKPISSLTLKPTISCSSDSNGLLRCFSWIHYTARFADGTVFDSSYKRGRYLTMRIGVGKVFADLNLSHFRHVDEGVP